MNDKNTKNDHSIMIKWWDVKIPNQEKRILPNVDKTAKVIKIKIKNKKSIITRN